MHLVYGLQGPNRQPKGTVSSSLKAFADSQDAVSPSSTAAAAGSTVGPGSVRSASSSTSSEDDNKSLPGSLGNAGDTAGAAVVAAQAAAAVGSSSGNGGAVSGGSRHIGRPPSTSVTPTPSPPAAAKATRSLLGQQLRRTSQQGSAASLQDVDGSSGGAGAAGEPSYHQLPQQSGLQGERSHRVSSIGAMSMQDYPNNTTGFGGEAGVQLMKRLQEQMEVIGDGFKRHSGMQLHLDALTHQYKHLNESMAALTAVTQALGQCVQQLQQQQEAALATAAGVDSSSTCGNQQLGLAGTLLPASDWQHSSALLLIGVGAAVGAAVTALLVRANAS